MGERERDRNRRDWVKRDRERQEMGEREGIKRHEGEKKGERGGRNRGRLTTERKMSERREEER